jgi:hypothetical protein
MIRLQIYNIKRLLFKLCEEIRDGHKKEGVILKMLGSKKQ